MIFEQVDFKGKKYRIFVPPAVLTDDTKNLLKEIFGDDIAIFQSEDIEIWAESNSMVNTSTVVGAVTQPIVQAQTTQAPKEVESDKYAREHGTPVSRNEGRAAGW
jgi:hypothetical protein